MTIDERLQTLMRQLPYANRTEGGVRGFEALLRLALRETARDQRHACTEALLTLDADCHCGNIDPERARGVVTNAPVGREGA